MPIELASDRLVQDGVDVDILRFAGPDPLDLRVGDTFLLFDANPVNKRTLAMRLHLFGLQSKNGEQDARENKTWNTTRMSAYT